MTRADLEAASPERMRRLVEVGISLSSELSLEALLRRLIETAVELTDAQYGTLGVLDRAGTGTEQLLTVGIDGGSGATTRDIPHERGVLVVPIRLRGTPFGNLSLTAKAGGEAFTELDEEIVGLFAAQAAVAIENARLYEASRQWSRQLESLNEVSEALTTEAELAQLLDLAARRLRDLLDARAVVILQPTRDGSRLRVESASSDNAEELRGLLLDAARSKAGRTLSRGRAERIDSLIDDPEVDQTAPRVVDASAALYVPLVAHGRALGVVVAYDKRGPDPRFSDGDMRIAQAFATRAAVAIELSQRVGRSAVQALLEGQELERKRLAPELHDETGQALASILLGLKSLEAQVGAEPVAAIRELVGSALDDVRRLTVELRPPALDDFGLGPALERLTTLTAERSGIDIQLSVRSPLRLTPDRETALYRIVQEALTNVIKHAGARSVSIIVTPSGEAVRAVIEDDGAGFDPACVREGALGLVGIRERVALLGGRFEVESAPDEGTTLVIELP